MTERQMRHPKQDEAHCEQNAITETSQRGLGYQSGEPAGAVNSGSAPANAATADRFEQRRLDASFEQEMARIKAWKQRGRIATAADRLEQTRVRAPLYRAAAAGQLTEREFRKLHGYLSALYGFLMFDPPRLVPMEPWSVARTFKEVVDIAH